MSSFRVIASMVTDDSVTIIKGDGVPFQVPSTSSYYGAAVEALRDNDLDALESIVEASTRLAKRYAKHGRVEVFNGHITVNGVTVNSYLVDRILEAANEGDDIEPLVAFLDNVMDNPSRRAVQDLYPFLEASGLPITEDGCFLAYKGVRNDFKDHHTGTFDNTPGRIVTMQRNEVDENPDQTCSSGLHACGAVYLNDGRYGFGSQKIVLVKINPADVVAFPKDYNNQKLRCCKYEVLMEVDRSALSNSIADTRKLLNTRLY